MRKPSRVGRRIEPDKDAGSIIRDPWDVLRACLPGARRDRSRGIERGRGKTSFPDFRLLKQCLSVPTKDDELRRGKVKGREEEKKKTSLCRKEGRGRMMSREEEEEEEEEVGPANSTGWRRRGIAKKRSSAAQKPRSEANLWKNPKERAQSSVTPRSLHPCALSFLVLLSHFQLFFRSLGLSLNRCRRRNCPSSPVAVLFVTLPQPPFYSWLTNRPGRSHIASLR